MKSFFFFMFFSTLSFAESPKIKQGHLEFIAIGRPAMIKIVGQSDAVSGAFSGDETKGLSGTLSLPIESLATGIEMRDQHMKEKYLEVKKYPTATLKVQGVPSLASDGKLKQTFSWPLYLHGVEKNVDVAVDMKKLNDTYSGDAEFSISLTDFNISIPTYLGVKVADKVQVKVTFTGGH